MTHALWGYVIVPWHCLFDSLERGLSHYLIYNDYIFKTLYLSSPRPIYIPLKRAAIIHHAFIRFQPYIIIYYWKQQLFDQAVTAANTASPLNHH